MFSFFHRRGWSWYAAKTPKWLQWLYPGLLWKMQTKEKSVYLSFDDGPITEVTEYVLDVLLHYNIKANFFCIGKNVVENPVLYRRIIREGHVVGNHSYHHVNGWKTSAKDYIADIRAAEKVIDSNLFRPPYGRITRKQIKEIQKSSGDPAPKKIIMWDVLSGDFDKNISAEQCFQNVIENVSPGSIIVFHDSIKAFPNMKEALPKTIVWLQNNKYQFALLQ